MNEVGLCGDTWIRYEETPDFLIFLTISNDEHLARQEDASGTARSLPTYFTGTQGFGCARLIQRSTIM